MSFLKRNANTAFTAEKTKHKITVGTAANRAKSTFIAAQTAISAVTDKAAIITARIMLMTGMIFFIYGDTREIIP